MSRRVLILGATGTLGAPVVRSLTERNMAAAVRLIGYFDKSKEGGDPSEANSLLGAPTTTLAEWMETRKAKL